MISYIFNRAKWQRISKKREKLTETHPFESHQSNTG